MKRGRLNRIVTIERSEVIGTVGYGEPLYGWVERHKFWAQRYEESETELNASSQIVAKQTAKFRADFIDGITSVDRLTCEGVTYNILGVVETGYREGLEITAEQVE